MENPEKMMDQAFKARHLLSLWGIVRPIAMIVAGTPLLTNSKRPSSSASDLP